MSLGAHVDILAALLAFFIAAASPGPATMAVAATSMARGRPAGLILGFGLSLGVCFWGVLTALGLGALMLAWAPALIILKIVGGLYLFYLAWMSAKDALTDNDTTPLAGRTAGGGALFRRGLVLNLLNPKAVLAWTAAIALGLPDEGAQSYLIAVVVLCSVMTVAIYAAYAMLFSLAAVRAAYSRVRRWCDALFAACFAAAGLRLIFWKTGST